MRIANEWEPREPMEHRQFALALRQEADQLGRAGYRSEAARCLLEARLHELQAAALVATSRFA